jgi:phosphatidylinositol glycan class B
MKPRPVRVLFGVIVALGAVARALAWRFAPALYPDAQFQYVEPAWRRVSGVGMRTWEWRDGLRSWVLPGYHGAWLALLHACGVRGPSIGRFVAAHWALASLAMIWAAFHAGASIGRRLAPPAPPGQARDDGAASGLLAAFLVATFPLLAVYSIEPLSELPSMIAFVGGMAVVAAVVDGPPRPAWGPALLAGALLSFSACVRDANAPLVVVPLLWLVVGRRARALVPVIVAALVPVLLFGIVDACTWGGFLSSTVHHLRFNVLEHGAEGFGREPALGYFARVGSRSPVGIALLVMPALFGIRATWPFVGSAVVLFALATSQAHKEERFVILAYPLLLIAAGGVAGSWLRARSVRASAKTAMERIRGAAWALRRVVVAAAAVAVVADGACRLRKFDYDLPRSRFTAQAWVGRQPDVTGLLVDWPYYTGGYLWFGRTLPQLQYHRDLLGNALFSHVLMSKDDGAIGAIKAAGFQAVYDRDGVVVLRRKVPASGSAKNAASR